MLTHIVCFKFADPEHAKEALARLLSMRGKIPGLISLDAGLDITRSARSYELGLVTRHPDAAALADYQVHPVHVEVAAFIKAHAGGSVAVDFIAD